MNLNTQLETAKKELIDEALKQNKISKALNLLKNEIIQLNEKNIGIAEQVAILSKIFKTNIKIATYKGWYYRNFDKKIKRNNAYPVVEKITKNKAETNNNIEDIFNKTTNIKSDLAEFV